MITQNFDLDDYNYKVLCLWKLLCLPRDRESGAWRSRREGVPTLSGYMEMHLNKVQDQPTEADLHRFVLMVGHSLLRSHQVLVGGRSRARVRRGRRREETGEVAIEQAYIDLMVNRRFNLRAGMVLVPVGILNERHEPPTFHGVERTFVDTVIVPTTWRDVGAGVFGDLGRGFSYRAYVVPGLDATGFTAEEGIAGRTPARRHGPMRAIRRSPAGSNTDAPA